MSLTLSIVVVLAWTACGVVAAGFSYAHFQAKYPFGDKREDLGMACVFGLFGPIGLVVTYLSSGFGQHGWRLR